LHPALFRQSYFKEPVKKEKNGDDFTLANLAIAARKAP
jgi:hypothetical protein